MAINWNIQTPIEAPRVVGQVPIMPNQLSTLAGGVMQGLEAGSAMQTQAVERARMQQDMAQSAALFPGQQQIQQQQAQIGAMNLQQAQLQAQTAAQMRQSFQQSWAQGMATMQKVDPAGYAKMQSDMATYQMNMQKAASYHADTQTKTLANYDHFVMAGANMARAAQMGRTPQEQNAIYQQNLNFMRKSDPETAALYPQQYDDKTGAFLIAEGTQAAINQKEQQEQKYSKPSELKQAQLDTDQAQQALNSALKSGSAADIDRAKQELAEAQAHEQSVSSVQKQQDVSDVQKRVEYVMSLQKAVNDAPAGSQQQKDAQQALDLANKQLKDGGWLDKVNDGIKAITNAIAPPATSQSSTLTTSAPASANNAPVQMPSFKSKEEFQSWYNSQPTATQQAVRSQLGGK